MKEKFCRCGADISACKTFFCYVGDLSPLDKKEVCMCDECFKEYFLFCDTHGPCDFTNSPEILQKYGCLSEEDAVIAFCTKCVQLKLEDLDDERINYLKSVFLKGEKFKVTEEVLIVASTFLPEEMYDKDPLLAGLMFLEHISDSNGRINEDSFN